MRRLTYLLPLLIVLFLGLYWLTGKPGKDESLKPAPLQITKYYRQIVRLQTLSNLLNRHLLTNKPGDVLQNDFLALRQEWLFTDVIAKTTKYSQIQQQHVPADSLHRLYACLFPSFDSTQRDVAIGELTNLRSFLNADR